MVAMLPVKSFVLLQNVYREFEYILLNVKTLCTAKVYLDIARTYISAPLMLTDIKFASNCSNYFVLSVANAVRLHYVRKMSF